MLLWIGAEDGFRMSHITLYCFLFDHHEFAFYSSCVKDKKRRVTPSQKPPGLPP
jgi:hypothetical protein